MSGLSYFFAADTLDDAGVEALYGTDGTADGTEIVADFRDPAFGIAAAVDRVTVRDVVEYGDGVVFIIEVGKGSDEAWYLGFSDGTTAGTQIFGGGEPGPSGNPYFPVDSTLEDLTVSGDTLAFIAETPAGFDRLVVVKPGEAPKAFEPADLATDATEIDGIAGNGAGRLAVSVALPADQGIVLIDGSNVDFVDSRDDDFDEDDAMLWSADTFIYASDDPDTITAVDATNVASTKSVTFDDIDHSSIAVVDGGVAFGGDLGDGAGAEPYFWDLAGPPTVLMGDVNPGPDGSHPDEFVDFNDGILFVADGLAFAENAVYFWDRIDPPQLIDTTELRFHETLVTLPDPGDPGNDIAIWAAWEDDKGADVFSTNGNPFFTLVARFRVPEGDHGDEEDARADDLFAAGEMALFSIDFDSSFGVDAFNGLYRTDGQSGGAVQILPVHGFSHVIVEPLDSRPTIRSDGGGDAAGLSLAENTAAVTTVAATAFDAITYAITGGADAARFLIDAVTGALAFTETPDFEAPVDDGIDNIYEVTVAATADSLADEQALAIEVTNVDGVTIKGTGGDDTVTKDQSPAGQPLPTGEEDVIRGKGGDDLLKGHRGNDDIKGNRGDDTLKGGRGDDGLKGKDGKDTLKGGKGADMLTGGKGADIFAFNLDSGADIITDFENGVDRVDLTDFGFANKTKALAKFSEVGTANDDQIAFNHKGVTVAVNGIDMGQLNGADLIV